MAAIRESAATFRKCSHLCLYLDVRRNTRYKTPLSRVIVSVSSGAHGVFLYLVPVDRDVPVPSAHEHRARVGTFKRLWQKKSAYTPVLRQEYKSTDEYCAPPKSGLAELGPSMTPHKAEAPKRCNNVSWYVSGAKLRRQCSSWSVLGQIYLWPRAAGLLARRSDGLAAAKCQASRWRRASLSNEV